MGVPPLSMFGLSVNFMHINSAGQPRQFALLIKVAKSPLCWHIGFERSVIVVKMGLCTPSTIFFRFTP